MKRFGALASFTMGLTLMAAVFAFAQSLGRGDLVLIKDSQDRLAVKTIIAVPGDTIAYHVDKIARRRNIWWYRAEAKVGDVLIAEAEVGAVISEA